MELLIMLNMFKILNKPSFAISVVGLTGNFLGAVSLFPLYFPEMIRMT